MASNPIFLKYKKRERRELRQEKSRLRRQRLMTDEERLADYRYRRQLCDDYVACTTNVKKNLMQKKKELDTRILYFVHKMTLYERLDEKILQTLCYEQGIFDGCLEQMSIFFFQEMRKQKPVLVKAGVDRASKIDAELNRIKKMYETLTSNSHAFAKAIQAYDTKREELRLLTKTCTNVRTCVVGQFLL